MCPRCGGELGSIPLPRLDDRGFEAICPDAYACHDCKTVCCYTWPTMPHDRMLEMLQAIAWCMGNGFTGMHVKEYKS